MGKSTKSMALNGPAGFNSKLLLHQRLDLLFSQDYPIINPLINHDHPIHKYLQILPLKKLIQIFHWFSMENSPLFVA